MSSVKPILRYEGTPDKKKVIYLQVIIDCKCKYYSLKKKISEKHWNRQTGKVKAGEGNAQFLNHLISNRVKEIEKILFKYEIENIPLTAERFHEEYMVVRGKRAINKVDLATFLEEEMRNRESKLDVASQKTYKQLLHKIRSFEPKALITDLNQNFISRFEDYLLKDCHLMQSTVYKHLKRFKLFVTLAQKKNLIRENPFQDYALHDAKGTRLFLTTPELKRVKEVIPEGEAQERVKSMFLFQCSTGLRFSDMIALRWNQVDDEFIRLKTQKNEKPVVIPIIENARNILNVQSHERETVFKPITNQKFNFYLHQLEKKAGLNKPLTSHIARHTFATLALESGIRMEVVSNLLGHSDIKTTQIYGKITEKLKQEEMKKMQ